MENKNGILNGIYMKEGINQSKLNNGFLIPKTTNTNNNLNQYPNTVVYGHINPINYDISTDSDNVHAKDLRKYSQDNIMNNIIKNLNNQNHNILNYNFIPQKVNPQQKIQSRIAQKQKNQSFSSAHPPLIIKLSKDNIFHANNDPVNQSLKSSDSFSTNSSQKLDENKKMMKIGPKISNEKIRNKSNYPANEQNCFGNANDGGEGINQYNIKNNNNSNLLRRIYNCDNINGNLTGRNNEEIKIDKMREEFKMIYDNRKYNYDKKVQRINPYKIPVPQSKKIVEKILGLKEKKMENKNNYQDGKTSMYEINSQPLQKPNIIYNLNNNNYELNQNPMINNNFESKNYIMIEPNNANDKFYINNNLNSNINIKNNIKDEGNKNIISREKPNMNNLNNNIFPQQFSNENQIYNDFNSQQIKMNIIQNNQNINQEHNMVQIKNQNQNQNIIHHQNQSQNYFIQNQKINSNINNNNPLLNIQLPPPTKKNELPQRANMVLPKKQIINPAQQNQYIPSQKQNQTQINYNISVNPQNLNLQQKANFFVEPSHQSNNSQCNYQMSNAINRQNIAPQQNPNMIQQQKENRNENLNMIPQQQNEFINYQKNAQSAPLCNIIDNQIKENIPQNIIVQKIYPNNNIEKNPNINVPQQNIKIPQNNDLNMIQKPPIMNTPHKRNINIIKQSSNINSTKQNLNLADRKSVV